MGAWSSGWGKFDSRIAERCEQLSPDDEMGSVDEGGHYARHDFRRATVLIGTDSQGFVRSEVMSKADADKRWEAIAAELAVRYEVIVGNVGTVYDGDDEDEANKLYREYVAASDADETSRAGGEDVTLMANGEPVKEHRGSLSKREEE